MHATLRDSPTSLLFVLKVASRCNLNCSYCYVYNKGDSTWKTRPAFMPDEVLEAALERIRGWCRSNHQERVTILFHGGEPLLAGPRRFTGWCDRIRAALAGTAIANFIIQTNAVLIDDDWIRIFRAYHISVGISIDGPRDIHDRFRVTHDGRGSYDDVLAGIERMRQANLPVDILCVVPFGTDGARVQRSFVEMGARRISYLLPDFTHDTISDVWAAHGPAPCADFLIPAFDDWWSQDTLDVLVEPFLNVTRLIMGGTSILDSLGNQPFGFVFIEADGSIEGLDILRVCGEGTCGTGLNVLRDDFQKMAALEQPHFRAIFSSPALPDDCQACPERDTCSGGYLPHRWSKAAGFNNTSVWCRDLLLLFQHIRCRLGVSREETRSRRAALEELNPC
jgi:uncharacterized protein